MKRFISIISIVVMTMVLVSINPVAANGVTVEPQSDTNPVGTQHTITAFITPSPGGECFYFKIISGPHKGIDGNICEVNGVSKFTYTGISPGTDTIEVWDPWAYKYYVYKTWVKDHGIPEFPTIAIPALIALGGGYLVMRLRRRELRESIRGHE